MKLCQNAGVTGFYPVQTIGQENIVAAKLVNSQETLLCLVHAKILPNNTIDIIVRSQLMEYTTTLANYLQRTIQ